jgi:hypothetical protein
MATLYLSGRCKHSMELLDELMRTNNRTYRIVDIDTVRRHMLPPVVTAVPMVLQHDGRTLMGEDLFEQVFPKKYRAPAAVLHDDCLGELLDVSADDAANPGAYMDKFYEFRETVPQETAVESKNIDLDALQAQRNQSLDQLLSNQPRPLGT